nr:autotransporter assembly complex family protein [Defluviimonas salinarum]
MRNGRWAIGGLALLTASLPAHALDRVVFAAPGADESLTDALRAASLVLQAEREKQGDAQALFAAARADYGRLLGTLYAEGRYSGVIRIAVDGQEAARIAPLDAPETIREIRITVEPGPQFRFAKARMRPYAPGTKLPPDYRDGEPARSTAIVAAAEAGVEGWRNVGHAKAGVADQTVIADHREASVDSEILLAPGPRVRFGKMTISGYERMNPRRIERIAGFPTGEVYDPAEMNTVATRLRRTGVFRTVALTEAETLGPGDTLDAALVVAEAPLRRFGFGAEASTSDGLNLSGYWLHRNLFGGGERLRLEGAVDQIGGQDVSPGYNLGVRIDRPATPVTDATAFFEARAERTELLDLDVDTLEVTFGLTRVLSDRLSAEAGLSYIASRVTDPFGNKLDFSAFALPLSLTWDNRDEPLDPRKGYFFDADLAPFYGMGSTGSGAYFLGDARTYRGFGAKDRVVLAGRVQLGTVVGSALAETPPGYLFFSGGGGTVRGQPYQSLGVSVPTSPTTTIETGGLSFAGLSGEVRAGITEKIGGVAFYDAGYISDDGLFGGTGNWHAGAGLGVRYDTGIGPIRFDVGLPVSGGTGGGVQLYVGIGQAF